MLPLGSPSRHPVFFAQRLWTLMRGDPDPTRGGAARSGRATGTLSHVRSYAISGHGCAQTLRPLCATNGSEAARNHLYDAERYRSVTAG
jgi:hypothetical protein